MGAQTCERSKWKETMRVVCIVFVAIAVAAAFDNDSVEEFQTEYDMPEESLMQVVAKLRGVVPEHMAFHVDRISHHAELMQTAGYEEKTKAYSHNFSSSKAAIQAALNSLTSQLQTGHNHDVAALNTSQNDNTKAINDSKTDGKSKTHGFRNKACPTKRRRWRLMSRRRMPRLPCRMSQQAKSARGSAPIGVTWTSTRTHPSMALNCAMDGTRPVHATSQRRLPGNRPPRTTTPPWPLTTPPWLLSRLRWMSKLPTLTLLARMLTTSTRSSRPRCRATSRRVSICTSPPWSSNVTSTTLPTTVVQRFAPIRLVPRILPAGTSPPRTSASAPPRPTSLSRLAPRTGRLPPLPAPAHTGTRRTTSSSTRPCMTMTTK